MRDQRRKTNVNDAMSGDDGGFVIVWMALMLLVLLAFCGFGIDVAHWWFVGQKEQRAADAAALAGSIYMPNDLPSAQAIALKVSAQNGYKNGVNATVTATQEPQPSRIRVTVRTTITNFFAGLVGYNTQTITRDAVADFQGPVPMGSPTSKLGQDPDDCDPSTSGSCANFWLNTSGPKGTKREGDRFATEVCNDGTVAGCSGTNNLEYSSTGYLFRIRVNSIQAGQPLVLQVYDPAWMYTEDFCNNGNMPTDLQQNNIPALTGAPWNITNVVPAGPGNITRYGTSNGGQGINVGGTRWCTGDQNAGGGGGNIQNTTYIVRKPDLTPWDDTDNVVAECAPAYFRGINQPMQTLLDPTNVEQRRHLCEELLPPVGDGLHDSGRERDARRLRHPGEDEREPCRSDCRRWHVPDLGAVVIRPLRSRTAAPATTATAMRAGFGSSSGPNGNAPDGTGVSLSATKNLPIYANAGSDTTPQFYLARITPTAGSGRTLSLNFYDIGDVGSGSVNVQSSRPVTPITRAASPCAPTTGTTR